VPSTRTTCRRLLGAGLAIGLIAPAQAAADDAGVYAAWTQDNAQYRKLADDLARGQQRFERSGFVRTGLLVTSARKTAALVHRTKVRMEHQEPSSDLGAKAKARALRSLDSLRNAMASLRKAIRAFRNFDGYDYIRLNRRSRKQRHRAATYRTEARKLFEQAGVPDAQG
jgi:hypothetical protein